MCLLMLMMVEDGPDADGLQIVSNSRDDVWLVIDMSISFVAVRRRGCRASAERVPSECRASHKQINRLPAAAEPIHLQKHKDLTLNRHLSSSPSQPDIHSRGNYKKRLTFVKLWIRVDQAEYL